MAKKANYYDYLCTFQLLKNNVKIIARSETEDNDEVRLGYKTIFESEKIDPEKLVIKIQEYEQLSAEAKEIISAILSLPEEILELFKTPKLGRISRRLIYKTFADIWKSKLIADSAVKEISKWVENL